MALNLLCIPKADLKFAIFLSQLSQYLGSQVCPQVILLFFMELNSMDDQFVELKFCETMGISLAS